MKTILITWASWGIWSELTLLAKQKGYTVIWTYYKDITSADNLAQHKDIILLPLDLQKKESIDIFVHNVRKQYGTIDFLVNNSAVMVRLQNIEQQSYEDIYNQIHTNLIWPMYLTGKLIPIISEWIINIASKLIKHPIMWSSPYISSKSWLDVFTKTLLLEHPHLYTYTVCPRLTNTKMWFSHGDNPRDVAKIIMNIINGTIEVANWSTIMVDEYLPCSNIS